MHTQSPVDATLLSESPVPTRKPRSCVVFGLRLSHMRTVHDGWVQAHGYSDGDAKVLSVSLISLTRELEDGVLSGLRLVIGRHSFWVMR